MNGTLRILAVLGAAGLIWTASADGAGGTNAPVASASAPSLVCEQPVFTFGDWDSNSNMVHAFVLTNAGTGPVVIRNVRTSCGCTTAQLATGTLAPGQTTELTAVLSLKGRRGLQHKTIRVESNDPVRPVLGLDLTGNVVNVIQVEPDGVHFEGLGRNDVAEKEVMVTGMSNVTFTVLKVECASPLFSATVDPVEEGRRYRVKIRAEAPRPDGRCATTVDILTDHPQYPRITIPVGALVVPEVMVSPATLVLSGLTTNRAHLQYLTVASPLAKPFKIEKIQSPDPALTVEATAAGAGRYQLAIRNGADPAALDGKAIILTTDAPNAKEVKIPIRALLPGSFLTPPQP